MNFLPRNKRKTLTPSLFLLFRSINQKKVKGLYKQIQKYHQLHSFAEEARKFFFFYIVYIVCMYFCTNTYMHTL